MGEPVLTKISDKGTVMYEFELKTAKVFHMKNLYKFVYEYLLEEGYRASMVEDDSDEYPETYYDEWRLPEGHMERRIWWRFVMNPEFHARPHTRYRYYVDLNFRNLWLKNIETVVGKRKVRAQDGEISIVVKAYLKILDDDIVKHAIMKYFSYFFRRRWIKQIREGYRDDLRHRMRKFQDAVKDFMAVVTYEDDQKNFHLERGL